MDLRRLQGLRLVDRHGTVTAAAEVLRRVAPAPAARVGDGRRAAGARRPPRTPRRRRPRPGRPFRRAAGLLGAASWPPTPTGAARRCACAGSRPRWRPCRRPPRRGCARKSTSRKRRPRTASTCCSPARRTSPWSYWTLDDARFGRRTVLHEPFDLITPTDHPPARRREVALGDAAGGSWVLGSGDPSTPRASRPMPVQHARGPTAVSALVAHCLGVAVLPRTAAVPAAAARTPLRDTPARHVLACVRRGNDRLLTIEPGLGTLEQVGRELVRPGPVTREDGSAESPPR